MTVLAPFWRLLLGSAFWELMVTFGNSLKPFLLLLFNSCNIFSHLLTLAHALSHTALIVTPWLPFIHYHLTLGLNTLASPNVTIPQTTRKHAWPKPNGPQTEEAALVTVLSDQKCIGNSSKSSFKAQCGGWQRQQSGHWRRA